VNDDSYKLHLDTSYGILLNIYGLPDLETSVVVTHDIDHFDQRKARDQINVDCFGFLDLTCSHRSDIYESFTTTSKTIKVASSDGFAASQMTLNIDQHELAFRSAWTIDDYVDGLLVNLGAYSSVFQDAGYSLFWDCGFIDVHPADSFGQTIHVSIRNAAGETRHYVNNTSETQRIVFSSTGTINSAGLTSIPYICCCSAFLVSSPPGKSMPMCNDCVAVINNLISIMLRTGCTCMVRKNAHSCTNW